ncbi:Auxin-responsive protein SAUR36 [Linum perenne]
MKTENSTPLNKIRGIKLRRRFSTAFKWVTRPKSRSINPISTITSLIRILQQKAKTVISSSSSPRRNSNCIQLGRVEKASPKKGHLAVYVGESEDEARRVVVPLIYFNHPLFGELLEEAERVYGFDHPGRISIPCGYSKFEKVKMRIDAWDGGFCGRRRRVFFRQSGGGLVR